MTRPLLKGLTSDQLREYYDYDPHTGEFTYAKGKRKYGQLATTIDSRGYMKLQPCINGKYYQLSAARVAWFLENGEIPPGLVIDHINHDKTDNRISNLRCVTSEQNNRNRTYKPNKAKIHDRYVDTSVLGVKYDKKYNCYIVYLDGKPEVSTYSFEDAKMVRWEWEFKNSYHENHGVTN